MNSILEVFGYGKIADFATMYKMLKSKGFSLEDLLVFVQKEKDRVNTRIQSRLNRESKQHHENQSKREATKKVLLLRAGEIEKMGGVKCANCSGDVYIEAICGKHSLVKKGYVRRGICGECGIEFGIR